MTTPIERAEQPAHNAYMHTACTNDHHVVWPAIAHAVFDSIDTNELAGVIAKHYATGYLPDTGTECDCGEHLAGRDERYRDNHEAHIAQTVKNWLTGK